MMIIDISWPITSTMTSYKNRGGIVVEREKVVEQDGVGQSRIHCDSHTGTHIDAPSHFIAGGKSIDQIPLESFNGPCVVIEIAPTYDSITRAMLEQVVLPAHSIVLFKTRNSELSENAPFEPLFVYLTDDGAHYLVEQGVLSVGIDYIGIERNQPGHETHITLLQAHIPIIEGLRLKGVPAGQYRLACLPLRMPDLDAAPARAILYSLEEV